MVILSFVLVLDFFPGFEDEDENDPKRMISPRDKESILKPHVKVRN
jgi:hypothetical protein